ncbi:MAG: hypothetical protein J0M17_26115, partial [Planctomycetes bacterium]|nr:hypothetical protein [Planctomycetota bacterium]
MEVPQVEPRRPRRLRTLRQFATLAIALGAMVWCASAFAQAAASKSAAPAKTPQADGFFDLIKAGGWVGHTILVLSVVAV